MTAVYCRAYLVTLGMLVAGGAAFVALAASDISGAGLGLALLICGLGYYCWGLASLGRRDRWTRGPMRRRDTRLPWC